MTAPNASALPHSSISRRTHVPRKAPPDDVRAEAPKEGADEQARVQRQREELDVLRAELEAHLRQRHAERLEDDLRRRG